MQLITSIKWGILLGILVSFGTQILTWTGLGLSNWVVVLTFLLVIVISFISSKSLWNIHGPNLTFLRSLFSLIVIILVGRLIFQSYMFVYTRYIDPMWIDSVSELWTSMMKESSTPEDQIVRQIENFRRSYEIIRMFTVEILKYGVSQLILAILVSLYFVFKSK